jgi:hypothetical protein
MPCGPPGATWGFVSALGTAHLDDAGYPEDPRIRMTAWHPKELPGWLRLAFSAAESGER